MEKYLEEARNWLGKARSSLKASEGLLRDGYYTESVSRSYYAMFYAARALLVKDGITTRRHTGLIATFSKEYIKTGEIDSKFKDYLTEALELRHLSDYDAFWLASGDKSARLLGAARDFVDEIAGRL